MQKTKLPFTREKVGEAGHVDLFPCYIMGEPWRYGLITAEQMKILGEDICDDPAGLCTPGDATIYFLKGSVSHTIAIHELMHAYLAETLTHSAKLTTDQTEEVMCDIAAFNWCRIVLLARIMVHNLSCYERHTSGERRQDWEDCPLDVITDRLPEHLLDLVATYSASCGLNPLLKAAKAKKKRQRRS